MYKPLIDLDLFAVVKFHPYRTAMVRGCFIDIDRNSEMAVALENVLAEKAGVSKDNHSAYEISSKQEPDAPHLFVWCSDFNLRIGTEIHEQKW